MKSLWEDICDFFYYFDYGLFFLLIMLFVFLIGTICLADKSDKDYLNEIHSDDVTVTEWISPDGVHYWFQREGNREMLAPRYDHDGNLVIDQESCMKKIDIYEAKDIANRYLKCMKKIKHCLGCCDKCKGNWKDYEIKRLCKFVLELKEKK